MRVLFMAAVSVLIAGLASNAAAPQVADVSIAGGELDPSIRDADVYVGVPHSGKVPPGAACQVAKNYVDYINEGKYGEVANLFADDALVLEPKRLDVYGKAKIEQFYKGPVAQSKVQVVGVSYLGSRRDCMVALAVLVNIRGATRYKLVSVDHFTLDARGKVKRMVAFLRP